MTQLPIPRTRILPGQSYPPHLEAIYEYMEEYSKQFQRHPSIRELTEKGFAASSSVIRHYFDRMIAFGMIERDFGIARGVRLIPRKDWKKHATDAPKVLIRKPVPQEITENA